MKVELSLSDTIGEPYAVIHAPRMTPEIQTAIDFLASVEKPAREAVLTVERNGRYYPLRLDQLDLVRVEQEQTAVYAGGERYLVRRRLYELEEQLKGRLLRISKSSLVNPECIESLEPTFSGLMQLNLKNGEKEYISRKYLRAFKAYLGLER